MLWRGRLTRIFLWLSVLAWGTLIGAKLYDLVVLAGAWSAAPPESLTLMPYGPRFPIDPGRFFAPVSVTTVLATFGALISGWNTPWRYRAWLAVSALSILAVWIFTVVAFWPRNEMLYAAASHAVLSMTDRAELVRQAHLWVTYDWCRIAMMTAGFVSAVRAISVPIPASPLSQST
jgi:anthrone oxygenase-like protein